MRRWLPKPGELVTLKSMADYNILNSEQGLQIPAWARFKVEKLMLQPEYSPECAGAVHVDGGVEKEKVLLKLCDIDKPVGWEPTYEMLCKDKVQAERVVDEWFKTGIHVWQSQDLSCAGRKMYLQAKGEPEKPHWSMGFLETIPPDQCASVFDILYLEENHTWHTDLPRYQWNDKKGERKYKEEQKQRIQQLSMNGWSCQYNNRENIWIVTREVVVHKHKE